MVSLKTSLALFYLRIMVDKIQRRIIFTTLAFAATFGVFYFFFIIFQCGAPIPGAVFWERFISRKCTADPVTLGIGYTHGLINACTDLVFAALPIHVVWNARMGLRQKALVSGIMIIGTV
jgi:hypothetical protein